MINLENNINDLLVEASKEKVIPSKHDKEKTLLIGIDIQNDFMEGGTLGVAGAKEDVKRLNKFIYNNLYKITDMIVSLDTHSPFQIFHQCWWKDSKGNNPDVFTVIKYEDAANGKWHAVNYEKESIEYLKKLKELSKKELVIWPYHCIEGTIGAALEESFSKMMNFFSIIRDSKVKTVIKGKNPLSEMYGIFKPEWDRESVVNLELLEKIKNYDKIFIAGEAKSHCVLESIMQILNYYKDNKDITSKIYIIEDCMSTIPGFEEITEIAFESMKQKYNVNIVDSSYMI